MTSEYQPRYVAYCRAQGVEPDAMLAADRARWPGGFMTGFVLWIGDRWAEWCAATKADRHHLSLADHAAFDAWLDRRAIQQLPLFAEARA